MEKGSKHIGAQMNKVVHFGSSLTFNHDQYFFSSV